MILAGDIGGTNTRLALFEGSAAKSVGAAVGRSGQRFGSQRARDLHASAGGCCGSPSRRGGCAW